MGVDKEVGQVCIVQLDTDLTDYDGFSLLCKDGVKTSAVIRGTNKYYYWLFYRVYNTLGTGFLEKVYENALLHEIKKNRIHAIQQCPIKVYYEDIVVGEYFADILVNNEIILEIKIADGINSAHEAQLLNYLKATGKKLGLLLYFGKEAKIRRIINHKNLCKSD
jgi:GxxExxY protein